MLQQHLYVAEKLVEMELERAAHRMPRPTLDAPKRRGLRRRIGRLEPLIEEVQDRGVAAVLVLLLAEAVALVVEDDVLDRDAVRLHRLDDLVRLDLEDARVVRALEHQERLPDLRGVEQRRDPVQVLAVDRRVAELLVERLAERLPVGGDARQRAHPVRGQ